MSRLMPFIGILIIFCFCASVKAASAEDLYEGLSQIETKGLQGADKFIRTRNAPPKGSTAYGPVQITGVLAKDFLDRKSHLFSANELQYLQLLVEQSERFAKYGREPNKPGYHPRYDYGGAGFCGKTKAMRFMYRQVALVMIKDMSKGKSTREFLRAWRGKSSLKYENAVLKAI